MDGGGGLMVRLFRNCYGDGPRSARNKTDIFPTRFHESGQAVAARGLGPMEPRMSGNEAQAHANWLLALAMMVGGALGVALPMALFIVWICS